MCGGFGSSSQQTIQVAFAKDKGSRISNSDHNNNSNYSDMSNDTSVKKKSAKSNASIATAPERKYEHRQSQRHVSPLLEGTKSNHSPVAVEKEQK